MRRVVFSHEQHARSVFIQTMHYSGARISSRRRQIAESVQQCVYERTSFIARAGVNAHSLPLVYHGNVIVLVYHVYGNVLGFGVFDSLFFRYGNHIADSEISSAFIGSAVHGYAARIVELFYLRTRFIHSLG